MKHNGPNDSAFPSFAEIGGKEVVGSEGLTTREYFAGQALVGLMANTELLALTISESNSSLAKAAEICFKVADAMIEQSKKGKQ